MWQIAKLALLILLPLTWGLMSDYLFAKLQGRQAGVAEQEDSET